MDNSALFAAIDRLQGLYAGYLKEICDLESPTVDKSAVNAVADRICIWAEELGFSVERFGFDGAGDLVAITMNSGSSLPPLTVSGHMDTVHPKGLFGYPPTRIEGDMIYGPGVTDCKGGIVVCMLAMAALKEIGFTARPVRLILQSDEELGSAPSGIGTVEKMIELSRGSVAFLNTEGMEEEDTAVLVRKGIVKYRFDVQGIAAHSSKCYLGASAILEAAHKIIALEKMKDSEGLTCNCGTVSGGTAHNTVAERCSFVADVRFANESQLQWVRSFVEDLAKTSAVEGCTCTATQISFRPAMPFEKRNSDLLASLNAIYESAGLPPLTPTSGTGGSDAAYTTAAGIPTIDNLGIFGGRIHSREEFASLSSLGQIARRIALAAIYL